MEVRERENLPERLEGGGIVAQNRSSVCAAYAVAKAKYVTCGSPTCTGLQCLIHVCSLWGWLPAVDMLKATFLCEQIYIKKYKPQWYKIDLYILSCFLCGKMNQELLQPMLRSQ